MQHGKSPLLVRSTQVLELAGRYVKRKLKDRPLDEIYSRFDSYRFILLFVYILCMYVCMYIYAEAGSQSNYQNRGVDAPMTIDELQVDIGWNPHSNAHSRMAHTINGFPLSRQSLASRALWTNTATRIRKWWMRPQKQATGNHTPSIREGAHMIQRFPLWFFI